MPELPENLLRLRSVRGVGSVILWRLLDEFGGADAVFGQSEQSLAQVKGMTPPKARAVLDAADWDARPEMEAALAAGVDIVPYDDPAYPTPLRHTHAPPVLLYVRGRLTAADQVAVGIVGTRRASGYGRKHTLEIASALARGGFTVVSGLARGIDTFAHIGCLNAGGRTVGVLGCGFDHMYPEENRDLALEMSRSGAVISEFMMATPPSRETFPLRNRIIAGMSLGLLVVEAPLRSGSLITARIANEMGRAVFAIPGRMGDAYSEGCNKLIRDGAVIVTGVDDIFVELNPSAPPDRVVPPEVGERVVAPPAAERPPAAPPVAGKRKAAPPTPPPPPGAALSEPETRLLTALSTDWTDVDALSVGVGLDAGLVTAMLLKLRMRRLVVEGPGRVYRRA